MTDIVGIRNWYGYSKIPNCSICEEHRASALWHGHIEFWICSVCAIEVLPTLIADAYNMADLSQRNYVKDKMISRFNEACYLQVIRKNK